ncbi:Acyl-CoA:lysophosphatidylglycerol acyltransferase 1-like, partial [Homarus americanus]
MGLRAALRIIVCTLNNFYCIPVHFCWIFVLQPLKWFATSTYWVVEGIMFRWLLSMVALWSYSTGYHVVELGDDVWDLIFERTLVLFNHQSTSDVPLIMAAFNSRKGLSNNIMWIMDHVFKFTNFGIVSWVHGDFFIHGGKDHRDASLIQLGNHLHEFYMPRDRKWLVLFPEGGFLKNRKAGSQRYAKKNNLPLLENVALPRVGALKVIMDNAAADSH